MNSFIKNLVENRCVEAEKLLAKSERKKLKLGLCRNDLEGRYEFFQSYLKLFKWDIIDIKKVNKAYNVKISVVGPYEIYYKLWRLLLEDDEYDEAKNSGNIGEYYSDAFERLFDFFGKKMSHKEVELQVIKEGLGWKIKGLDHFYLWLFNHFKEVLKIEKPLQQAVEQVLFKKIKDKENVRKILNESIRNLENTFDELLKYDHGMWFALPQRHLVITMVVRKMIEAKESLLNLDKIERQKENDRKLRVKLNKCKSIKSTEERMECEENALSLEIEK